MNTKTSNNPSQITDMQVRERLVALEKQVSSIEPVCSDPPAHIYMSYVKSASSGKWSGLGHFSSEPNEDEKVSEPNQMKFNKNPKWTIYNNTFKWSDLSDKKKGKILLAFHNNIKFTDDSENASDWSRPFYNNDAVYRALTNITHYVGTGKSQAIINPESCNFLSFTLREKEQGKGTYISMDRAAVIAINSYDANQERIAELEKQNIEQREDGMAYFARYIIDNGEEIPEEVLQEMVNNCIRDSRNQTEALKEQVK